MLFYVEVHIKFSCGEYIEGAECSYWAVSWGEETRGGNTLGAIWASRVMGKRKTGQ